MKKNFIILIFCILISCKNEQDLGNNYFYLPNYEALDIGYPYGSIIYKSKTIYNFDSLCVYADILKVQSNERFVIAHQKPNIEIFNQYVLNQIDTKFSNNATQKITIELLGDTMSILKSKFRIYQFTHKDIVEKIIGDRLAYQRFKKAKDIYYIIDKTINTVYIFYNENDFEKERKKRNIELNF